ncbi:MULTISPECIES: DUF4345 domain-containing protein [unclassified Rhizobium]|uniref:DUF4345 domain-containing protein n=1 Tax=unclassified Rhizobium TaxID=2613769 RepID=UPI00071413E2|nr:MULTISPECIES: DUF4345 domain-containing protein [unclassified Rhizobium]KQS83893.1 hypothetical protein ASG50_11295 [Rhizobium sp. Leaf386]KQS95719.1 hypothetical protein ASG42_29180 [Rhizobium sp. Leaf391]KQU08833.1 hypothetical protein ASG68_21940 [Rhizobium sp. Leaf453]
MTSLAYQISPTDFRQRRLLQVTIAVLALLPVFAGLCGVVTGAGFLGVTAGPADLDSHVRFLSGLFLAFGLSWYTCIPAIEKKTERIRFLAILTVCGGLARLASLVIAGVPSTGHVLGLCMELLVVPALVVWHARVSRLSRR